MAEQRGGLTMGSAKLIGFDAADRPIPLDMIGTCTEISWTTGWGNGSPGGCQSLTWKMDIDPRQTHPALLPGKTVQVWDGPAVWTGRIGEPGQGAPRPFLARGLSQLGRRLLAMDGSNLPTADPNVAIDQAIARAGLPWTRNVTLWSDLEASGGKFQFLYELLDLIAAGDGSVPKRWGVWADGECFMDPDPTGDPDYLLLPSSAVMGVTDSEFSTHVYALRVSGVSGTPPQPVSWAPEPAADDEAAALFGRSEEPLDLTELGSQVDATIAQAFAATRLAENGGRVGWTEPVTVTDGQLIRRGGAPARLSHVRAGEMFRTMAVANAWGQLIPAGYVDLVIGETQYVEDSKQLVLRPVGLRPRTHKDLLKELKRLTGEKGLRL